MELTNTNNQTDAVDVIAQDFKAALLVVSLLANLAVFTTWMAFTLA